MTLGITLESLSLGYARGPVLNGIDLTIRPGEVLVIVGASGSGKSTLLRALAGLLPAHGGRALAGDEEITGASRERAMVFQDDGLLPWRTVRRNVELPLRLRGLPRGERKAVAREWLARVGLEGHEDRLPRELSGGMRQRVQLARALAGAPRAVLMDEPFGALDAQTRAGMQALLLDVLRDTRATVVFVTHDVDEALLLADRVVVLGHGGIRTIVDVPGPRDPAADRTALRAQILEEL
ncbi:Organosulfonate ABC transporter ATP-binding protein [[Actinomadura] parvosata subsp. kistnae]|uniref:Nitrate ABC transporter ATP-binding protein n=1 Tax=[Actinomadura] parvosata subsp. kistnae TaxID=1909395 RepID=A0A1U9ZY00_9ACTN|nr:ABC transporter ATP-binding protein [Nonomuraea sp. ATCC 55076]AQZ62828.1 nitrate ABC transporter ATP-binding protein [Nonomuraea sp. ATCC 55076]SPL98363.1 Organosulfonate ABC transporter ATP-binding protein [Actinomadura parvosata subsp. kistnae]